ncbi:hypothetical protein BGZ61DRAFT_87279 [Ilyonectria robusta]|uniref:uncharacterized protein n=1 Tax=Ilyonectria robusta TaxID=1079257 RepID=UPI001E8D71CD|nr:uncharacterized protein BGZ61DRAFT_87279 [Ilyonectria robusta]KAH8735868.1 hypothetical protein BGZ61DRAFT_87279 [Ilyonectria robusta]
MSSSTRTFMQGFQEVKVDQITESRISTVVAMLPTSLQSSMGPIRFLRRSISLHTLRSGVLMPEAKPRPLSEADVPAPKPEGRVVEILDQSDARDDPDSKAISPRPMSRVLYSETVDDDQTVRAASGVHWKFARQGTSLVNISIDGGKPAMADEDVIFERKAFIDGVTYLLKALPQDLDACELRRIQSALPEDVTHLNLVAVRPGAGSRALPAPPQPRSILHRGVQMTVVNLIFLLSFLMPYLMYLLKYAARMERKYKVSETVVGHGLEIANSIGKQSASLTESMCQMNDGKVGQVLLEAVIWTVDGVAQGISDGLGEGLSIVGARSAI